MCKEVQALKGDNIDLGRECFIGENIKNQYKPFTYKFYNSLTDLLLSFTLN